MSGHVIKFITLWPILHLLNAKTGRNNRQLEENYRLIFGEQKNRIITVEPPITDPPTSGQPLYNGHWLWHQLKLLQN